MQLAIISDTHMPRGARQLPDDCVKRLDAADVIIHAGDFHALPVLRELERHGPVLAVYGNVDDPAIRSELPATRVIELGAVRIGLIHDAGPRAGRLERLRAWFPDTAMVVFGHSHIPLHEQAPDRFQIFNPGSPTERRRSPNHSMGIGYVEAGTVRFELVILGSHADPRLTD